MTPNRTTTGGGLLRAISEEDDMSEDRGSSVPEPIPQVAPGGFAAVEPLPDLVRRVVREELRPLHLLLEELIAREEKDRRV
jgi:hypothetical protein